MALSLVSLVLFLASSFSNARTNFLIVCSKRLILLTYSGTCTRGLSSGIYAGLPGGVSGGRGEVDGFGITSIGAIVSEI